MALAINTTGKVPATGSWLRVSTEGEVIIAGTDEYFYGFSGSDVVEPEAGYHAPASTYTATNEKNIKLSAGQHLWVKGDLGITFTITATNPVT